MKEIQRPAIFLARLASDQAPCNSLASIDEWAKFRAHRRMPRLAAVGV
jgi:hypothetical protein